MSLPQEKKNKLADKVADDVKEVIDRHYKDLRKHEISKEDANSIVRVGGFMGMDRANTEE